MSLNIQNIKNRDLACATLMLSYLGKRADEAFAYLTQSRVEKITPILSKLLDQPSSSQQEFIQSALVRLKGEKLTSLFYHAHPAWVSDRFKDESPIVLAQIITLFPKDKVGMFLKDLSKEKRKKLRRLQHSKQISPRMRNVVKKKCEQAFPLIEIENLKSDPFFQKLSEFSLKKNSSLLQELGLSELTIALSKVNRSAIRAILNRLKVADAMEIKKRLKEGGSWDPQVLKEAQLHILSLDFEKLKSDDMMQEIGFGVLSRAFAKDRIDEANYFMYRFPPQQGYMLKRYINSQGDTCDEAKIKQVQTRILSAIKGIEAVQKTKTPIR